MTTSGLLNKMWHICTMEGYSVMKNEVSTNVLICYSTGESREFYAK